MSVHHLPRRLLEVEEAGFLTPEMRAAAALATALAQQVNGNLRLTVMATDQGRKVAALIKAEAALGQLRLLTTTAPWVVVEGLPAMEAQMQGLRADYRQRGLLPPLGRRERLRTSTGLEALRP